MSQKPGRIPVNRRIKPPHPSQSPSSSTDRLHRRVVVRRSSKKPLKFIKRCNSEPTLLTVGLSADGGGAGDDHRNMTPPGDGGLLFRPRTCTDVFASSPELFVPHSPQKFEKYNRDAKVVVNVTVEGSPGPIRAMVKLGSSVDETIRVVRNKYNAEGRSPRLDQNPITTFDLHHSYFSLQCLDKSEMIGEIGSRSFYMRKSKSGKGEMSSYNSFVNSEIDVAKENEFPSPSPTVVFSSFISQKFKKIIRRTSKLWKILGCIDK